MRVFYKVAVVVGILLALVVPVSAEENQDLRLDINVIEPDRINGSVAIGESHQWLIRCKFQNVKDDLEYTFLQTLDPVLTYEPNSLCVTVLSAGQETLLLSMEEHYTFTGGGIFVEKGTADRICVSLTDAGKRILRAGAEIRITYRAKLKESAPVGTRILGTAQLNCTDSQGNRTVYLSGKATVSTGGFSIRLTNIAGDPLPGGEFMLAREAEEAELETDGILVELLDTGEEIVPVIYVAFYDASGKKNYATQTDGNGTAKCCGIAYGSYYLVQTDTPEAAFLPAKPRKLQIDEVSHLTLTDGWKDSDGIIADHTVRVVNGEVAVPETGGPGTTLFTVSGMLVIGSACILLWLNRGKRTAK